MSTGQPRYNEQEFRERSDDIAKRTFNLKVKGYLISGALAVAAIGVLLFFPPAMSFAGPLIAGALAIGSGVASLVTMQEAKKLELDEAYVRSLAGGDTHWGAYNEHVGHGVAPPMAQGIPPHIGGPQNKPPVRGGVPPR